MSSIAGQPRAEAHRPAAAARPAPGHQIYVPRFALAKLGLALLGLVLVVLSFHKLGPLVHLAVAGAPARAEAVRIILRDTGGKETVFTSDAQVLAAEKVIADARDHESTFYVEYRFTTAGGRQAEARSPIGQHVQPLQPLRDRDGLPSTIMVWYDRGDPRHIALPLELGTWFMPGMLLLFGSLGTFMGLLLWRHAGRPIEMPDLSRAHGEQDAPRPAAAEAPQPQPAAGAESPAAE